MTTEVADAVSETLVQEAIVHLDRHLSDARWLKDNREFNALLAEYAHWTISGRGHLTVGELERVRQAFENKGWRQVRLEPKFHDVTTNWRAFFQTNA